VPRKPLDFEHWFAARAGTSSYGTHFTLWQSRGWLSLPSGQVVAAEPYSLADPKHGPFTQTVPPGRYPVILLIAEYRESGASDAEILSERVAAARLGIRDEPVAAWEMAVQAGQNPDDLSDDEFFGYPVDGGTGCFTDAQNLTARLAGGGFGWQFDLVQAVSDNPTVPITVPGRGGEPTVIAFSTGGGDGTYPTWVGRAANGDVACFVTDFLLEDARPAAASRAGVSASYSWLWQLCVLADEQWSAADQPDPRPRGQGPSVNPNREDGRANRLRKPPRATMLAWAAKLIFALLAISLVVAALASIHWVALSGRDDLGGAPAERKEAQFALAAMMDSHLHRAADDSRRRMSHPGAGEGDPATCSGRITTFPPLTESGASGQSRGLLARV
jgi:Protein of unknown function (DUF4241)